MDLTPLRAAIADAVSHQDVAITLIATLRANAVDPAELGTLATQLADSTSKLQAAITG